MQSSAIEKAHFIFWLPTFEKSSQFLSCVEPREKCVNKKMMQWGELTAYTILADAVSYRIASRAPESEE